MTETIYIPQGLSGKERQLFILFLRRALNRWAASLVASGHESGGWLDVTPRSGVDPAHFRDAVRRVAAAGQFITG